MSFFSDLFKGNFSNLGSDLAPSNIFSDTGSDFAKQPALLKDAEIAIPAAIAAFTLPEALPGLFSADAAATGVTAAADTGFDLSTIGAGTTAAGTALTGADAAAAASTGLDLSALGLASDSTSAFATDPGLAAIQSAAPLGTTASAAGDATSALGSLSVPGFADSSVPIADVTNDAGGLGASALAGSGSSTPSFLSQLGTGALNSITKNPLPIAAAGGALAYDVLKGNPDTAAEKQLQQSATTLQGQAAGLTATGTQLTSYLTTGPLPPGQQAQVPQAVAARKAQIIANAAAHGQNTNPTQNSGLAQDLAAADQEGLVIAGQLETQLASAGTTLINSGLNATGLSSEIYQALVKIDQHNVIARLGKHVRDAVAHGSGADDANRFDLHFSPSIPAQRSLPATGGDW